jgi:hypothetical protein
LDVFIFMHATRLYITSNADIAIMMIPSRSSFPLEYLAGDVSAPLLGTSIAFLILETIFIGLLYTSRYLAKGESANLSMEVLLTLTYIVCVGKRTVVFRKSLYSSVVLPRLLSRQQESAGRRKKCFRLSHQHPYHLQVASILLSSHPWSSSASAESATTSPPSKSSVLS